MWLSGQVVQRASRNQYELQMDPDQIACIQISYINMENPLSGFLPRDQANLVLIMLVSIPLSYILFLINNKYLLLTLSMALTIGFQSLLFPTERWFLWGQQQVVYLLIIFSPRKYVGHVVLFQSFFVLTVVQLRRMYINYGDNVFDVTGILMMQLFNYIGLGYNYQNGGKPEESLSADQKQRRVVEQPSYVTYMGYVNFLPACLVGPVYEYVDYDNYLHRRGDYQNIPNTLPAVLREGGVFLLSIIAYFATSHFHIDRVLWQEFEEYGLLYKLFYMVVCITYIELKYISAWSLGMMSMRASGITYNPSRNVVNKDNSITYNFSKVEVTDMKGFYLTPAFKVKGDSWNMSTQVALRRYIYQNIYNPKDFTDERKRKKRQMQAQLGTVLTSALWHGLYPGYYISFVHWLFFMQIGHEFFRERQVEGSRINKLYKKHEPLCNQIENALSTFAMTYFGMPFHLMTFTRFWMYVKSTYFLPYILLYIANYLIVQKRILSDKGKKVKGDKKENQEEAQKQN